MTQHSIKFPKPVIDGISELSKILDDIASMTKGQEQLSGECLQAVRKTAWTGLARIEQRQIISDTVMMVFDMKPLIALVRIIEWTFNESKMPKEILLSHIRQTALNALNS